MEGYSLLSGAELEVVTGLTGLLFFSEATVALVCICAVLSIVESCLLVRTLLYYELLLLKIIFVAWES